MNPTTLEPQPEKLLEVPDNATRTSEFGISEIAREAYSARFVSALEHADDLLIALEIRSRARRGAQAPEQVELDEFIREQGYDPADLGP
jgi:hypothetical protein